LKNIRWCDSSFLCGKSVYFFMGGYSTKPKFFNCFVCVRCGAVWSRSRSKTGKNFLDKVEPVFFVDGSSRELLCSIVGVRYEERKKT